jgi:uncharacterized protein (DUF1684 family)
MKCSRVTTGPRCVVACSCMDMQHLLDERSERDRFLREHYSSPLPDEHLEKFSGLDYFPPDAGWVVAGRYEAVEPHDVQIPSTAGRDNPYKKIGVLTLSIEGTTYQLTVLDDGDGDMFVPFRDGTSGVGTYEGGRYVGLSLGADSEVSVDFNSARNPWCVYDEEFICPLPPVENWISERIPAGEKMYAPPA